MVRVCSLQTLENANSFSVHKLSHREFQCIKSVHFWRTRKCHSTRNISFWAFTIWLMCNNWWCMRGSWLSAYMPRHKNHRHGVELTISHRIKLIDVSEARAVETVPATCGQAHTHTHFSSEQTCADVRMPTSIVDSYYIQILRFKIGFLVISPIAGDTTCFQCCTGTPGTHTCRDWRVHFAHFVCSASVDCWCHVSKLELDFSLSEQHVFGWQLFRPIEFD